MANPLQNDPGQRRTPAAKVLAIVDVVMTICEALLRLFGRRGGDPK
jgi:hypothetical protein